MWGRRPNRLLIISIAGMAALAGACGGGDAQDKRSQSADVSPTVDPPQLADAEMPVDLPSEIVLDMVDEFCQAAESGETSGLAGELANIELNNPGHLADVVEALAGRAATHCPRLMESAPDIDRELARAAAALASGASMSVPSTVGDAGTGSGPAVP